jgi:hypothetical protein
MSSFFPEFCQKHILFRKAYQKNIFFLIPLKSIFSSQNRFRNSVVEYILSKAFYAGLYPERTKKGTMIKSKYITDRSLQRRIVMIQRLLT